MPTNTLETWVLPTITLILTTFAVPCFAGTVGFEDVGANLPIDGNDYYNGADEAGGFSSGGASFSNSFTDFGGGFTGWDGWAYSQTTDTTTPGFENQYSAITGGGVEGSATYGVGFTGGDTTGDVTRITLGSEQSIEGAYFTNTTYAALSMLDGDAFSKKFGGDTGGDPDWFLMTISGFDATDALTGSVEVYLADYRHNNSNFDFILDEWLWVDLTGLGDVKSLGFTLTSTDNGEFGMNTPAYIAMDGLVLVPEPGTAGLFVIGLLGLARCGGWRRAAKA